MGNYKVSTPVGIVLDTSFLELTSIIVRVEWTKESGGRWKMEEVFGSEKFYPAQLVLLALGFLGPENDVLKALGVKQDGRSNIETPQKVSLMVKLGYFKAHSTFRNTPRTLRASLPQETVAVVSRSSSGASSTSRG